MIRLMQRIRWWLVGKQIDLEIARKTAEQERDAWNETLAKNPEYAEALRRGDKMAARAMLQEIINEGRVGIFRTRSFRYFLEQRLREQGYTGEQIMDVLNSLPPPRE